MPQRDHGFQCAEMDAKGSAQGVDRAWLWARAVFHGHASVARKALRGGRSVWRNGIFPVRASLGSLQTKLERSGQGCRWCMIPADDYLFPNALTRSPNGISKCLVIGSCMSEDFVKYFRNGISNSEFDYIIFNNVAELPEFPPSPLSEYDFQLVQIALRSVLTDRIIAFHKVQTDAESEEWYDAAITNLEMLLAAALKYNSERGIITFVSNFVVPQFPAFAGLINRGTVRDINSVVRRLNIYLEELIMNYKNVYIIDIENIASVIGKRYFLDDPHLFFSHGGVWYENWADFERGRIDYVEPITEISPSHLVEFYRSVWRSVEYNYRVIQQIDMVKLVIFDLDDTLWRGQIAEHYGDNADHPMFLGWPLGLSEAVFHLKARGIQVAICSKNTEAVVNDRWDRAAPLNWLSRDDFVCAEINWDAKADNISKILQRLSLTARSTVFVDDNPVEREAVQAAHPDIRVIGSNPFLTRSILLGAPETQVARVTEESANRMTMLQKQQEREVERGKLSRDDFLFGLGCVVTFERIDSAENHSFYRTFELLNKTNQFNTTGKRWTHNEIEELFRSGGKIYCFKVSDKHTDYGLVGVILFRAGEIVQFCMSCRVLGLEIESSAVKYVVNVERDFVIDSRFAARVISTDVNFVCLDVFERSGFSKAGDQAGQFELIASAPLTAAAHLEIRDDRGVVKSASQVKKFD